MLIKATNASGKTGKQKRKWSETMEHAGSKHLMECPACWANKLFQIERNSGRLNRATWNISSRSFSQLPIGKSRRGWEKKREKKKKKNLARLAIVWSPFFICSQFWGLDYSWMPRGVKEKVNVFSIAATLEYVKYMYRSAWENPFAFKIHAVDTHVGTVRLWAAASRRFPSQQRGAVWTPKLIFWHDNQYSQRETRHRTGWGSDRCTPWSIKALSD